MEKPKNCHIFVDNLKKKKLKKFHITYMYLIKYVYITHHFMICKAEK